MTPAKKAAAPARARRSTAAEIAAAASSVQPGAEVYEPNDVDDPDFDPDVDFDMSSWQAERDSKAQVVEATRGGLLFRIADRRSDPEGLFEARIPLLSKWRTKMLRMLETGTVSGMIESLTLAAGDPELEEVLDELEGDEVGAIIEHLTNASGVTPGESGPSGASSRSTRRR